MRAGLLLGLVLACVAAAVPVRVDLADWAKSTGAWHVTKASVELPDGANLPVLISAPQKPQPNVLADSIVSVTIEIDEQGRPVEVRIDNSSDPQLNAVLIAMIREWRFEAALRGGVPVASRAHLDLGGSGVHNHRVVARRPGPGQ